jgi:AcrR family transcriptional regulator
MTKKQPREKRAADIVGAAVEVFLQNGYEGASMEAIAQRAGLTKGGLYHHFAGKDEVLLYANERLSEPIMELMARAARGRSAAAALRTFVRDYVRYWVERPRELQFFFLTMTKAFTSPQAREWYARSYAGMLAFYEGLLAAAVEQGSLTPHDTRARALTLAAAMDGLVGLLALDESLTPAIVERSLVSVFLAPKEKTR